MTPVDQQPLKVPYDSPPTIPPEYVGIVPLLPQQRIVPVNPPLHTQPDPYSKVEFIEFMKKFRTVIS